MKQVLLIALLSASVQAQPQNPVPAAPPEPALRTLFGAIEPGRLMAQVERLAAFGTRHTASETQSPTRGIGAARRWIEAEWRACAAGTALQVGVRSHLEPSKPWFHQQWKDKIAAGFTNSASMNGDKLSTLHYLFTLSQQHSMIWVGTGLMPSNSRAATRNDVNYVASFSGAMASTPSDASVDEMLPGDLETARLFGVRVAEVTAKFNA